MHLGEEFSGRMRFWVQANLVCCQLWQAYLQNDSKQTHAEPRVGERQSSNNIASAVGRVMPPTRSCPGFHVSDTMKRILNNRAGVGGGEVCVLLHCFSSLRTGVYLDCITNAYNTTWHTAAKLLSRFSRVRLCATP